MTGRMRHRNGVAVRPVERFDSALAPVSRYDLVLWLVPLAFLLAFVASATLAISTHTALVGASLISALAIVDAVALHPPRAS
ncbi:hypothetical protein [Halalkalicoccus subterraneus]|uniref:hypothetical protein n=1 Tax=Halalkalicoccus subterraneus TaxID=2675002 RepID=UPI0013CE9335|nr:hypothetical protein [Halalkalicoccus subterraneus]